jgi:hypothetical protein
MDAGRFDTLVRAVGATATRRAALKSLGGGAVAAVAAARDRAGDAAGASAKGSPKAGDEAAVQDGAVQTEGLRRPLKTTFVFGASSAPLSAGSGIVVAPARCGGRGTVVGCGHQINGTDAQLANVVVGFVTSDPTRSECTAGLRRIGAGTAGATIQAIAVCLAL